MILCLAWLPYSRAGDKVTKYQFTQGDSTLEVDAAPFTEHYIEAYDLAGAGTDTLKVYIEDVYGNLSLAYLSKVQDTSSILARPTQSTGVIITSTSAGVFWKLNYCCPSKIYIVRSNASTLTDSCNVVVKSMTKPTGMLHDTYKYLTLDKKFNAHAIIRNKKSFIYSSLPMLL
jgi:hypothetical protein